jgi:hypothetical protein
MMALAICVRIARLAVKALAAGLTLLPAMAADNAQLLAEFRKTKPDIAQVHVVAETPLLVAVSGEHGWAKGELLGVFAHRGDEIVPISMVPNNDYPAIVSIEHQSADSITLGLSDPDYGTHTDSLKIFFDPRTYFPKRIVRFAPVRVRQIAMIAGVLTLSGTDGNQDFTARERNGVWQIATGPATVVAPPKPLEIELQFRPDRAKQFPQILDEKIGPYQKVGTKIWIGKTFLQSTGAVGVGDVGYFDTVTQDWTFLHIEEMAEWSASALLVEPATIWVGLTQQGDDGNIAGGLLRYDRSTGKATHIPLNEEVEKIVRIGTRVYCGTTGGFAVIEHDEARRFEFSPELNGSYTITPGI